MQREINKIKNSYAYKSYQNSSNYQSIKKIFDDAGQKLPFIISSPTVNQYMMRYIIPIPETSSPLQTTTNDIEKLKIVYSENLVNFREFTIEVTFNTIQATNFAVGLTDSNVLSFPASEILSEQDYPKSSNEILYLSNVKQHYGVDIVESNPISVSESSTFYITFSRLNGLRTSLLQDDQFNVINVNAIPLSGNLHFYVSTFDGNSNISYRIIKNQENYNIINQTLSLSLGSSTTNITLPLPSIFDPTDFIQFVTFNSLNTYQNFSLEISQNTHSNDIAIGVTDDLNFLNSLIAQNSTVKAPDYETYLQSNTKLLLSTKSGCFINGVSTSLTNNPILGKNINAFIQYNTSSDNLILGTSDTLNETFNTFLSGGDFYLFYMTTKENLSFNTTLTQIQDTSLYIYPFNFSVISSPYTTTLSSGTLPETYSAIKLKANSTSITNYLFGKQGGINIIGAAITTLDYTGTSFLDLHSQLKNSILYLNESFVWSRGVDITSYLSTFSLSTTSVNTSYCFKVLREQALMNYHEQGDLTPKYSIPLLGEESQTLNVYIIQTDPSAYNSKIFLRSTLAKTISHKTRNTDAPFTITASYNEFTYYREEICYTMLNSSSFGVRFNASRDGLFRGLKGVGMVTSLPSSLAPEDDTTEITTLISQAEQNGVYFGLSRKTGSNISVYHNGSVVGTVPESAFYSDSSSSHTNETSLFFENNNLILKYYNGGVETTAFSIPTTTPSTRYFFYHSDRTDFIITTRNVI